MMQLTIDDRSESGPLTPGRLLRSSTTTPTADLSTMFGFGGLHGGLLLAMLTKEFATSVDHRRLHHVTAQFHRPAGNELELTATRTDAGRTLTRTSGYASHRDRELMSATAVFADLDQTPSVPLDVAPPMPEADPPEHCAVFSIPAELVPFARHTEIRPTDDSRPFTGGAEPTLTAWIRLVEDDDAPDAHRLIMLLDALAPSYAAVLTGPAAIPTVELSIRLSPGLERTESPWVLLRATTLSTHGNWIDERIDAWSPDGDHLGAANQVRLLTP